MSKFFSSKSFILYFFIAILACVYLFSNTFCDLKVNDFITKIQCPVFSKKSPDNVVLISVDSRSLNEISWPWQRKLYSNIFDYLEFYSGAKAIVFNNLVLFPDTYNPQSDDFFYKNLSRHKKLINTYILFNSNLTGEILPSSYIPEFEEKNNVSIVDKRKVKLKFSYKGLVNLPKKFLENVKILSYSQIPEDSDTIVRNYNLVVSFNDKIYPSLALSAYAMYTGINSFVLYDNYLCSSDDCKTLKVPLFQKNGKDFIGNKIQGLVSYIKWYRPISDFYSHETYSAIDIINSYNQLINGKEPIISPDVFKDKIVIIGLNADSEIWEQLSETPVLKRQADIDVHAVVIDNLIENSFITIKNNDFTLFITIIFCIFIVFGFKKFKHNILFTTALSVVYFSYYVCLFFNNIYVPPITPIITMYFCAVLKKLFTLITTDKTSEMIKLAMGKYVSKDVMKKVLSNLDKLEIGGIRAKVTILFVDIRNFTQISENLNPSDVTSILNEYFSEIEPVIAKYKGIVNKYMGDGVLAVFGEPIKNENHAKDAIYCGLEIIQKVKVLREKLLKENKPKIEIGIAINTGEVFVGNIGTKERLEYTIIGDNVNLAYRIESYNQVLKTQFLISEYTYEYVKDYVEVVKLTQVEIKGKSKPIDIYEVLKLK